MSWTTYVDGVLAETGVDNANPPTGGTVTDYNPDGSVAGTRAYTAAELAIAQANASSSTASVNLSALLTKAQNALTANQTYLAIVSPTQAQAVAQVGALTRQIDALIRIQVNQLGTISDT